MTISNHLGPVAGAASRGSKVIHTAKNLFCNVVSICNLVQEFNGLVSIKGQRKLALFTFNT